MQKIDNKLREKIKLYIKNGLDISNLIKDKKLDGEDLSYAIIKNFNRSGEKFYKVNFSHAKIGEEGKVTVLSNNEFYECRFDDAKFLGKIFFRKNKCFKCNFDGAWMPNVEAQYTEFDNKCTFCETFIRLGVDYLYKAKFSTNLFQDLLKFTNLEVREKEVK